MAIQLIKNRFFGIFDGFYSIEKHAVPIAPSEKSHMDIPDEGYIKDWKPITFLKLKGEGPLADMSHTDIGGRLCSSKLRKIIEENLTEHDNEIQWLPMHIKDEETGDITEYYYLHFPEYCDVLDLERSTIDPLLGGYDKEIVSYQKVKNRSIFNCPQNKDFTVVSKKLKEVIFKSGCTGISAEQETVIDEISEDEKISGTL